MARRTRFRSRSVLARPNIWRLIILMRLPALRRDPSCRAGQPGGGSVEIPAQASGEGPQRWFAIDVYPRQPAVEFLTTALGEDLRELTHLVVGGAQGRAAFEHRVAGVTLALGE